MPCNSPCSTSILGVKKSNDKWTLVQDLWIIDVIPVYPVVPKPLLSEIPEWAKYFSVIGLKDVFFSILLAVESQFLFAFEDPIQPASQLMWTVLTQAFCDSPHLFRQSLSQYLQNFYSPEAVVIKYVDGILLCAETEEACSQPSEDFRNFWLTVVTGYQRRNLNFANNLLKTWT